jgi:hypothetical protein
VLCQFGKVGAASGDWLLSAVAVALPQGGRERERQRCNALPTCRPAPAAAPFAPLALCSHRQFAPFTPPSPRPLARWRSRWERTASTFNFNPNPASRWERTASIWTSAA